MNTDVKNKLREGFRENRRARKESFKEGFGKYGLLIIGILVLCVLTLKDPSHLEDFTINDIQATDTKAATGWFIAGEMHDGHRFASSTYHLDEETGICEVTLREYRNFGFIGGNDFVVYIKGEPSKVKEIWYVFPKEYADSEEVKTLIMKDGKAID